MPLQLTIEVKPGGSPDASFDEEWSVGATDAGFTVAGRMRGLIQSTRGRFTGFVTAQSMEQHGSAVARLMLETPVSVLLARRDYAVVHAGAVVGSGGAVVIRGGPGSGKSTLVAAAYQRGLEVLGDETVLVARRETDDLMAAVRDVTLLPDSPGRDGLERLEPTKAGGEAKLRLDLFSSSAPEKRRAQRVATVVLGSRNGGAARLDKLSAPEFIAEYAHGHIPQENWSGTPDTIATAWAQGGYRLSGATDLRGAVDILTDLAASGSSSAR